MKIKGSISVDLKMQFANTNFELKQHFGEFSKGSVLFLKWVDDFNFVFNFYKFHLSKD